jgi:hypothetical protein
MAAFVSSTADLPPREMDTPAQGQAFFHFGDDVQRFEDVFCVIGSGLRSSRHYEELPALESWRPDA